MVWHPIALLCTAISAHKLLIIIIISCMYFSIQLKERYLAPSRHSMAVGSLIVNVSWVGLECNARHSCVFCLHTPVAIISQSLQAHVWDDSSSTATDEGYKGEPKGEQLLLPELDTILKKFQARDKQISMLEEELQDKEKKIKSLVDWFEQQQKSKWEEAGMYTPVSI